MGSSPLPKDSCGHETADKHTKASKLFHQGQTLITDATRHGTPSHTRDHLKCRPLPQQVCAAASKRQLGTRTQLLNWLRTNRAASSGGSDTMWSSFGLPVHVRKGRLRLMSGPHLLGIIITGKSNYHPRQAPAETHVNQGLQQ